MTDLLPLVREHTCLCASFQQGPDACFSRGNSKATWQPLVVQFKRGAIRFADAADYDWAQDESSDSAADNFPFSPTGFSGTILIWLVTEREPTP